ncbi:MAG: hypothetical protein APF84_06115 [Gracilibacter sp. BRH_c7a]|nr:MAG: hypothetical protein APF84_06115 [Gracilibacter sp. BRH_c7a]
MSIIFIIGIILYYKFPLEDISLRYIEVYLIVTCSWITVVLFGTLPYLFSGTMGFTNAFFETMSGFTTTGASILTDIESIPPGILMWRALTQWFGGMGIIVLFVALVTTHFGSGASRLFGAESPGPVVERVTPRISDTAKKLWMFYMVFTIIQMILLNFAGMTFFDSMAHTFTSIASGGFSTKNASIGFYLDNNWIQLIIILFMFLGGTNFTLFYLAWYKKTLKVFQENDEFKLYIKTIIIATLIIILSLYLAKPESEGFLPITALFQVVSIITTTGFATVDYDLWPNLSRGIMFILLFVGGSLGSTAGGIKIGRFIVLIKYFISELHRLAQPKLVQVVRVNGMSVDNRIVSNTLLFFFAYMFIVGFSTLVMAGFNLDLEAALTSVLACIGVIGPGLGAVGPTMNYAEIPIGGKYFLSLLMLVGRLEIFTIMVLFFPRKLA